MYTARSDEQFQKTVTHTWSKLEKFWTKIQFSKQPGGSTGNKDGQFITFLSAWWRFFLLKYLSAFEKLFFCITNSTYHTILHKFCILTTANAIRKPLSHLRCPFCITLNIRLLIHNCWTLFIAGKNKHLIAAVSSENCNVHPLSTVSTQYRQFVKP